MDRAQIDRQRAVRGGEPGDLLRIQPGNAGYPRLRHLSGLQVFMSLERVVAAWRAASAAAAPGLSAASMDAHAPGRALVLVDHSDIIPGERPATSRINWRMPSASLPPRGALGWQRPAGTRKRMGRSTDRRWTSVEADALFLTSRNRAEPDAAPRHPDGHCARRIDGLGRADDVDRGRGNRGRSLRDRTRS
jgi:hypothetical protein